MRKIVWAGIVLVALLPTIALAKIGVGVGTAKIDITEPLKPGGIYILPPVTVLNTGNEVSGYGASIEYLENQPEMKPPREWFDIQPATFDLAPGDGQEVRVTVHLPFHGATPGRYFAYIEGHPVRKSQFKGAVIGVAAATKLQFSVVSSGFFGAVYYRVISLFNIYKPWSIVALMVVIGLILLLVLRKIFPYHIRIGIKKN